MPVYGRPRGIGGPASASAAGSLSAVDFGKLAFVGAGTGAASQIISPDINFVTGADVELIPAQAGYGYIPLQFRYIITAAAGTYTTLVTAKAGNNATFDNVMASSANVPSATGFTAALALLPIYNATGTTPTNTQIIDLATAVTLKITTPGVGSGLVLRGRIICMGLKVPMALLV